MAIRSLNNRRKLRLAITGVRRLWLVHGRGILVDPSASISLSSRMVSGRRGSIVIGPDSLVPFKTLLVTRTLDERTGDIVVGRNCFVGGGSTIMPGVTISDGSIVGAGAVVTEDVPAGCAVGDNPARVLRENITVGRFGRLDYADENSRRLWR